MKDINLQIFNFQSSQVDAVLPANPLHGLRGEELLAGTGAKHSELVAVGGKPTLEGSGGHASGCGQLIFIC